jgi:hypothetical protein
MAVDLSWIGRGMTFEERRSRHRLVGKMLPASVLLLVPVGLAEDRITVAIGALGIAAVFGAIGFASLGSRRAVWAISAAWAAVAAGMLNLTENSVEANMLTMVLIAAVAVFEDIHAIYASVAITGSYTACLMVVDPDALYAGGTTVMRQNYRLGLLAMELAVIAVFWWKTSKVRDELEQENVASVVRAEQRATEVVDKQLVLNERAGRLSVSATQVEATATGLAAAVEELSSTVNAIACDVAVSATVANRAVIEASQTSEVIAQLGSSSDRIGAVSELIAQIAAQTNLLALNATIEAARAGEAGRGFAVVADEVKSLAGETSRSAGEIGGLISDVRRQVDAAVASIAEIVATITELDGRQASMAVAIEEQSVTTSEVARGVSEAAVGVSAISAEVKTLAASAA